MTLPIRKAIIIVAAAAFVVVSQWALVSLGHPEAVWLWCDVARLCGAAA